MTGDRTCLRCGAGGLEQGFLADFGQGLGGDSKWVEGPMETNWRGVLKRSGRRQLTVLAVRCPSCSHIELVSGPPAV